jgi:hypothetical protein
MLAMAVMLCAGSAMAVGADHIGIYSDNVNMNQCSLQAASFVIYDVYVVHKFAATNHGGAKGSQFKVVNNTTMTNTGAAPIAPFLQIGAWNTDWTLAYAVCQNSDAFPIAKLSFGFFSPPPAQIPPCAPLLIVPAPSAISGQVESIDCNDVSAVATGGSFHFQPDASCAACDEPTQVPTHTSTWGAIKSLYR